jgi:hypothetical protein
MNVCYVGKTALMTMLVLLINSEFVNAHVSEQGIVLLLPTDTYILSGCLAVIVSMIILAFLQHDKIFLIFTPFKIRFSNCDFILENHFLKDMVSIISLIIIIALINIGSFGSRDPLTNLLPLTIWTFWWIAIFIVHCILGNIWSWINPWTGFYNQVLGNSKKWLQLPTQIGHSPAIILFIAFYIFIIADIAPADPARLSNVVFVYLVFTFIGMITFGAKDWLERVECFTILFKFFSLLSPIKIEPNGGGLSFGLPGWKAVQNGKYSISQALFFLTVLASGSFDGVNETFWWLGQIGINPLAFPGRSAVVFQSTGGMLMANILLYAIFAASIYIGLKILDVASIPNAAKENSAIDFGTAFSTLTISVLPIAAVYHFSHYLTSLMVDVQYFIAAISDPLSNGANYLRLVNYQVTAGFLNDVSEVKKIWLTQAGVVVAGHIIAALMAHFMIAKLFSKRRDAILFHTPIALFMSAYTWFGLWLLASPRGA